MLRYIVIEIEFSRQLFTNMLQMQLKSKLYVTLINFLDIIH